MLGAALIFYILVISHINQAILCYLRLDLNLKGVVHDFLFRLLTFSYT
jgi:hypothetical protein